MKDHIDREWIVGGTFQQAASAKRQIFKGHVFTHESIILLATKDFYNALRLLSRINSPRIQPILKIVVQPLEHLHLIVAGIGELASFCDVTLFP